MFDLPPGDYTLDLTAFHNQGKPVTTRKMKLLDGDPPTSRRLPTEP
jgi:hypothetical protein